MSRKFFKRFMPSPEKIQSNRWLRFLGGIIHDPNLWHFNRHSISRAVAIGLFWAMIPMPLQMLAATLSAFFWRANLSLSIGLVWLTNPITIPPVFYACYKFGSWILGIPPMEAPEHISLEWIMELFKHSWLPLYLGSLILALLFSICGYFFTLWYWRWSVGRTWKARQKSRRLKLLKLINQQTIKEQN